MDVNLRDWDHFAIEYIQLSNHNVVHLNYNVICPLYLNTKNIKKKDLNRRNRNGQKDTCVLVIPIIAASYAVLTRVQPLD